MKLVFLRKNYSNTIFRTNLCTLFWGEGSFVYGGYKYGKKLTLTKTAKRKPFTGFKEFRKYFCGLELHYRG